MPHIKPDDLRQIGYQLFETAGCPPASARAVTDHLVESSLYGHDSHGSLRLYEYVEQIRDGIFDPKASLLLSAKDPAQWSSMAAVPWARSAGPSPPS